MIDIKAFSKAQKLVWAKNLLDTDYNGFWKILELDVLGKFNNDSSVLWKADAPDCVLNMLKNTQLAESLRVWYRYRDLMKENLGYEDYHLQDLIWWNRKVRLKTQKYFFYQNWFDQGIYTVDDLYRGPNFVKTFEDLVIEFDISIKDRRKYSYLMNGISMDWFHNTRDVEENLFDKIVASLFDNGKITKSSYNIFRVNDSPSNTELFWYDALNVEDDVDWGIIHDNNFNCCIETQLRAFYFKIFHKAICTNKFLAKIGRSDSPFCHFCKKVDETLVHMFCECEKISPLWDDLVSFIEYKTGDSFDLSNYKKMFGLEVEDSEHYNAINFLFLYFKFYIHRCKFQNKPHPFKHIKT